jgi:hypothetical protein
MWGRALPASLGEVFASSVGGCYGPFLNIALYAQELCFFQHFAVHCYV